MSHNDHAAELKLQSPLELAKAACDSLMEAFKPEQLPPAGRWHYHQGIFLHGMLQVWAKTGDDRYLMYPKQYVEHIVDEHGNFLFARDELDAIMPGLLLFPLHDRFGDPRYMKAAAKLRRLFDTLNTTSEGAFWHKDKYPYQMWLDGLYMGGVYALIYGSRFDEPALADMVLRWERLMRLHMTDERTGMLYHAWDERRDFPWANRETGCSPEFWGRSLGWYGMALGDFLDILPPEHKGREELKVAMGRFVQALVRFQDRESGLWYQVVDKGDRPDNWLETSCTSLFVYTIAKAVKHGCVDADCLEAARRGCVGLSKHVHTDEHGQLIIPDICTGTSAGDYAHYVNRPVCDNDLHGAGAFILACVEMDGLL